MKKINVQKIQRENERKAENEQFKEDSKYGRDYARIRSRIRLEEKHGKGVAFLSFWFQCFIIGVICLAFFAALHFLG